VAIWTLRELFSLSDYERYISMFVTIWLDENVGDAINFERGSVKQVKCTNMRFKGFALKY
jgi:ribosome maturation factor RimP